MVTTLMAMGISIDFTNSCSNKCLVETGYTCSNGTSYITPQTVDTLSECHFACGDSKLEDISPWNEVCDDGNAIAGDGNYRYNKYRLQCKLHCC